MAARENLVREVRVDKNGVPAARWVRPETGKAPSLNLPAPVTAPGKEAVILSRIEEITAEQERLQHDDSYRYNHLYSKLRMRAIRVARFESDLDRLATYTDLFPVFDLDPRDIHRCLKIFRENIGDATAGNITEEHVRSIKSYFAATEDDEDYSQESRNARDLLIDGCIELSMRESDSAPRIASLLERGIRSLDEIKDMLNESQETHGSVSGGFL